MRYVLFALLTCSLAGCCGYGGPGCDSPLLLLCGNPVSPSTAPVAAMVMYGDDTGIHPSVVHHAEAVPEDRLHAYVTGDLGVIALTSGTPGPAELRVGDVEGWGHDTFYFAIDVAEAAPSDVTQLSTDSVVACDETDAVAVLSPRDAFE